MASVILGSHTLSLVSLAAIAPIVGAGRVTASDLAWGGASGVAGLAGVGLLYRGMTIGSMSVVAPLTAVMSAVIPIVVGVGIGERPGLLASLGLMLAIPAIALASGWTASRDAVRTHPTAATLTALASGLGFGFALVLLDRTGGASGLWPLVMARLASASLVAAWLSRHRSQISFTSARGVALVALVGAIDVGSNVFFLLANRHGLLALVAVLAGLYPVATVALAMTVLRERVTRLQVLGLVAALVAVALISLPS